MKTPQAAACTGSHSQGKINKVRILKDPIRREADQKINRPSYQFAVTGDDPKLPLVWSVSAKGALQQIIGIMKANRPDHSCGRRPAGSGGWRWDGS